jgi:hypothetical protein
MRPPDACPRPNLERPAAGSARSLSSARHVASRDRVGDKALAQTEPELRCRGRSHPPSSRA